jgi:hypothetical protein
MAGSLFDPMDVPEFEDVLHKLGWTTREWTSRMGLERRMLQYYQKRGSSWKPRGSVAIAMRLLVEMKKRHPRRYRELTGDTP